MYKRQGHSQKDMNFVLYKLQNTSLRLGKPCIEETNKNITMNNLKSKNNIQVNGPHNWKYLLSSKEDCEDIKQLIDWTNLLSQNYIT